MKLKAKWLTAKHLSEAPRRDQLEVYSGLKGMLVVMKKWLALNLYGIEFLPVFNEKSDVVALNTPRGFRSELLENFAR